MLRKAGSSQNLVKTVNSTTDFDEFTETIPAGVPALIIEVLPTADDLREIQGVYLQLMDAEPASAYFASRPRPPGRKWDALVALYDGPEWTVQELRDAYYDNANPNQYSYVQSRASALNDALQPRIAGSLYYPTYYYGAYGWNDGCWDNPTGPGFTGINGTAGYSWNGVATDVSLLVGATRVGTAAVRCYNGSSATTLPAVFQNGQAASTLSEALGVNPSGSVILGWAHAAAINGANGDLPTVWVRPPGSPNATEYTAEWLGSLDAGPVIQQPGKAKAMNRDGIIVGHATRTVSFVRNGQVATSTSERAFRTEKPPAGQFMELVGSDELEPFPVDSTVLNHPAYNPTAHTSRATAVNISGMAVGAAISVFQLDQVLIPQLRAAIWRPRAAPVSLVVVEIESPSGPIELQSDNQLGQNEVGAVIFSAPLGTTVIAGEAYYARKGDDSKHLQLYSSSAAASLGGVSGRITYTQTGAVSVGGRQWLTATLNSSPVAIGLLSSTDAASEATGISDGGLIAGWSGVGGSTSVDDRAFFTDQVLLTLPSSPLRPLNDKHFVHGLLGLTLERITAVNADGSMVGKGRKDGQERAFFLRRLKSE